MAFSKQQLMLLALLVVVVASDETAAKQDKRHVKRDLPCGRHRCRDDLGTCHDIGQAFWNSRHEFCTCTRDRDDWGGQARAVCDSDTCHCRDDWDNCRFHGESFRNMRDELCTCRMSISEGGRVFCDDNRSQDQDCKCLDSRGRCHPMDTDFSDLRDGVWKQCRCLDKGTTHPLITCRV